MNKSDLADEVTVARLQRLYPSAVTVSSTEGAGLDRLSRRLSDRLAAGSVQVELLVPYTSGEVVGRLRREGEVLAERHRADGTLLDVRLSKEQANRYRKFRLSPAGTGPE